MNKALDYVTHTINYIGQMTIGSLFKNGLGPLKTKSTPCNPPPDFVLRGPNPLIKANCHVSDITWLRSQSINEPQIEKLKVYWDYNNYIK